MVRGGGEKSVTSSQSRNRASFGRGTKEVGVDTRASDEAERREGNHSREGENNRAWTSRSGKVTGIFPRVSKTTRN